MPGFKNVREWPDAEDSGQSWVTGFRKAVPGSTTTTSAWADYSYFSGSPAANFYASAPLEASTIEASRGLYVPTVAPARQFVRNLKVMSAASGATSTANARQALILSDLLLYYPFIDTDAVGEEQAMVNAVAIPRYDGGQVIAVGQSAGASSGRFTFTYTNDAGVPGRVSQNHWTFTTGGGGLVVASSLVGTSSYHPFCHLQAGDKGVRSIESVTFTAGGGGLMALVIVKPLMTAHVTQECRTTTTGNIESFGACDEFASVISQAPPRIIDGAVLGFFAAGHGGSISSSVLTGIIETTWN